MGGVGERWCALNFKGSLKLVSLYMSCLNDRVYCISHMQQLYYSTESTLPELWRRRFLAITLVMASRRATATTEHRFTTEAAGETQWLYWGMAKKQPSTSYFKYGLSISKKKKNVLFYLAPVFHIISAVETSKNTRWNRADCHALEENLLNNTTLPQILHHGWTRAPSPTLAKLETSTHIILLHPRHQFLRRWTNSVDHSSRISFQYNRPISISKIPVLPSFWITSTSAPDW